MDSMPGTQVARVWPGSLRGEAASCVRMVLSWTTTGGLAAGGLLLGVTALASPADAQELLPLAPVLFILGAAAGLVHGSILAYVGRPPTLPGRVALAQIGIAGLAAIPALLVAWVATAWISLTSAVLTLHAWSTAVVTSLGWIAGIAVCCWAAIEGWHALERAFARWPESRPGALLISGTLAILALTFVLYRPSFGPGQFRLTSWGALLLAFMATLWIATPVVIVALHFVHKWLAPAWDRPAQP